MLLSKYASHWYGLCLYIWLFGYYFKMDSITKILNPYYIAYVFCFGFLIIESYHVFYKKYHFQWSFLIYKILLHIIPLLILIYINYTNTSGALLSLMAISIPYVLYMIYSNKSPVDVYFNDFYPKDWKDLDILCKTNNVPICLIKNLLNN